MASRRKPFALVHVLVLSAVAVGALAVWVLVSEDGLAYYATPLRVRGYAPQHAALKPSGTVGHAMGRLGFAMMLVPVAYVLRKRWSRLASAGPLTAWLELHIFCGIVGPALVTFHTAFKFNGLISVAYWSMMLVTASGFVGRYWYVRIPKSIRGVELSRQDIEARVALLTQRVADSGVPSSVLHQVAGPAAAGPLAGRRLSRALRQAGVDTRTSRALIDALAERSVLLRRLGYLERTKRLFAAWHLFHMPLVYLMFVIGVVHVGVAVYFGYAVF